MSFIRTEATVLVNCRIKNPLSVFLSYSDLKSTIRRHFYVDKILKLHGLIALTLNCTTGLFYGML